MIAKGCTNVNTFSFPYAAGDIAALYITYKQKGKTVLEKTLNDCTFEAGYVSVNLSQEDTLKLTDDAIIKIQIRVRFKDGFTNKSKIIETYADEVLKEGVI